MMGSADLIVRNARIASLDGSHGTAEALAASHGRIVAVGSEDQVLTRRAVSTIVIDANGAFIMPGLHDIHTHPLLAGRADLFECRIHPAAGLDEIAGAIRSVVHATEPGEWIIGGNWGAFLIPALHSPDLRRRLDEIAGDRPLMLRAASQHNRLVNAAALKVAGVPLHSRDETTPGLIRSDGEATGLLLESASLLVEDAVRRNGVYTPERLRRSVRRAVEMLHTHGITTFMDAGATRESMEALSWLDRDGGLNAWSVSAMLLNDPILGADVIGDELFALGESNRTIHHRPDFVKIFLDGVPSTKTAAFHAPYLCAPGEAATTGAENLAFTPDELTEQLTRCAERGLGAKIHCTGDAAVTLALDAVATVRADGHHGMRIHIAHGLYLLENDIARGARLRVVADISPPLWFPNDIHQALTTVLHPELVSRVHPNRSLLEAGAQLAGGSDWPVSQSAAVWPAIQGLVTREDPTGHFPGTLWPEQAISVSQAIEAYTTASAQAMGMANVTGSLSPGKSADFIVIDRDPLTAPADEIADIRVMQTWFEGKLVYSRGR